MFTVLKNRPKALGLPSFSSEILKHCVHPMRQHIQNKYILRDDAILERCFVTHWKISNTNLLYRVTVCLEQTHMDKKNVRFKD